MLGERLVLGGIVFWVAMWVWFGGAVGGGGEGEEVWLWVVGRFGGGLCEEVWIWRGERMFL